MSSRTKEIIDALATALNATVGAPSLTARTFKYYRPLSVSGPAGALVPALSIAPAKTEPEAESTDGSYEVTEHLLVTYYAGQMDAMTMGAVDQGMAATALDVVDAYTGTIRGMFSGIPAITAYQTEATLGAVHYGHIQGGIWAVEINVTVRHWE